ncbi:DUF3347 domain-containing protein [Salinimicrobium terrae]|uniref:DUF3347 domain-containing protein n=1 Tax=Salinimicrobium terrae TaxID=470866 RepID=UPI00041AB0C6|nr:DUF3347 domain-containing protein [Salinimicrobium terrae]
MKTQLKTTILASLLIAFIGCKENQSVEVNTPEEVKQEEKMTADIADQHFIDGMTGAIWHHYLAMKMALTESDADQVQQSAGNIAEIFTEERADIKAISQRISETEDIEAQRILFAQFTEEFGPMFEDALSGGTIYKKFCPMAFDNKGAYWYADVEEISNPYFGDRMPDCGSIEKTISK